ncbi:tail fiber domain-containing protein [Klebsiella aerogenes]|uniref:tail fiber domain-containing protein n=1 Tax=Klebsiella aerogenes TaxID=548 RepID=UPI0029301734|nr:tail fiber domain-containing protein [Klebsiella aerogenes]
MANISDELAASIQKCFDRTYVDLANQQQFLFGAGNVTVTKPDGTTGTVKSWAQFLSEYATRQQNIDTALTAANKDQAKTTAANTWTKSQTWNAVNTFKDLVTFEKQVNIGGKTTIRNGLELFFDTPYIDFHHGNSEADFTHRIITEDGALTISPGLRIRNGGIGVYSGTITNYHGNYSRSYVAMLQNDPPTANTGDIIASPASEWRFRNRGADSNGDSGGCAIWYEEQVGTAHKLVMQVRGFNAPVQYTAFLPDGRIQNSTKGFVQFQGTSDARLKHDIKPTDGQQSVERIRALEMVTFVYNDDEQNRTRRGIIAQQAREVDPQYVKNSKMAYMKDGEKVETEFLQLDNNVIMMDTLAAVQVLIKRVDELEDRLSAFENQ